MKTQITLLIVFSIFCSGFSFSQEKELKHFPLQLSFVYPASTQGAKTVDYCYNFSLNALAGYTGAVKGCELGGLVNLNKAGMSGFQAGGIGNVTGGNVKGMQAGGIFSIADTVNGIQISGITSISGDVKGIQVSGIASVAETASVQISGITNISGGTMNGIQIGGIMNRAGELNGLQLGLINISDTTANGVSIGLINYVSKGFYQELSVSAADYLNVGISYKAGLKRFYNIYTLGMNFVDETLWVAGLGFGHISEISKKYSFQPEIVCYGYFPLDFYKTRDTYVTHIKLGIVREISPMFAITFAPSIYGALKSDRGEYDEYGYKVSPIKPFYSFTGKDSNSKFELGVGFSLALNIR
jgi:hypothetical protein